MRIVFIDYNTQAPVLDVHESDYKTIPRKGEPIFIGGHPKQLVKYVRWYYIGDGLTGVLERVEVILE